MINKLLIFLKNDFKRNYKFYIALIIMMSLLLIKLDYYILSPGGLVNLTDRISVQNPYKSKGSFNLTYVSSRDGNIINVLFSYIIPSWDLESIDESRIEDESAKDIEKRNKIYLRETSYDAIIAAFNEANIKYEVTNTNVTVSYIFNEANTNLEIGDVIKSINGENIDSFERLKSVLSNYKENDRINIKVLRNNKQIDCYSILFKEGDSALIGVSLSLVKTIKSTPKIEYKFKNNESGSSSGLMSALEIYNKITPFDLTKGRKIAGTGTIDENGNVGKIDGVKYKLQGAINNKADIFIAPKDNYDEAIKLKKRYNYKIDIIMADNLHNVIEKLK